MEQIINNSLSIILNNKAVNVSPKTRLVDLMLNSNNDTLFALVDGSLKELKDTVIPNCNVTFVNWNDHSVQQYFWHTSAHLLGEALESLYSGVKFGIGPAISNGFYYDVDLGDHKITPDDFPKIEKRMLELAKQANPIQRIEISKQEAIKFFTEKGDEYKLELLEGLQDGEITFYKQGNFTDLCRGPHIPNTKYIKAVKIKSIAGAYWRGDENNKQLTRIYGVSFPSKSLLKEHLALIEEAKKRDHRKIGFEQELFTFSEKVGAGLPIWLPKGTILRNTLQDFLTAEQKKRGYQMVITPHIGKKELYMTSGHYEKYGEDSFQPISTPKEGEEFLLKPMNCPHHCEVFSWKNRSYKELPLRIAEYGTVYRYEQSGELHGLSRVRGFTQDDSHIFCTDDQLEAEFISVIDLVMFIFEKLGFDEYLAQLSFRSLEENSKYLGTKESWEKAENAILNAARKTGLKTVVEYGEAAFYGPKLDFMVKDALGRSWQLGTIQVDYNLPERFELEYVGADGGKHRPVMIHRAPFGSFERFISVLIENCAGNFPLWLAPIQIVAIPVVTKDSILSYTRNIIDEIEAVGGRIQMDDKNISFGKKIREAQIAKIPLTLIIGEKEVKSQSVSIRDRNNQNETMKLTDFLKFFKLKVKS